MLSDSLNPVLELNFSLSLSKAIDLNMHFWEGNEGQTMSVPWKRYGWTLSIETQRKTEQQQPHTTELRRKHIEEQNKLNIFSWCQQKDSSDFKQRSYILGHKTGFKKITWDTQEVIKACSDKLIHYKNIQTRGKTS